MQANCELFLKDELEGHVSVISPEMSKALGVLGLRGQQFLVLVSFGAMPVHVPACIGNLASNVHIYDFRG